MGLKKAKDLKVNEVVIFGSNPLKVVTKGEIFYLRKIPHIELTFNDCSHLVIPANLTVVLKRIKQWKS